MFIKLGEGQERVLEQIIHFFKSEEDCFSLVGFAGTGKSLLIKYIIKYLEDNWIPYTLCAPTHKAKVVLERFTEREGVTLHKLLSLSPMIEIMNLDFKDLRFVMNSNLSSVPSRGVVICDEGSMVNDDLYDALLEKCKAKNTKLLIVGDIAQLRPVTAIKHSKVFDNPNKAILDKIYRQSFDSGLVEVLPILRESVINKFEDIGGNNGSIICYDNVRDFLIKSIPYFKKAIKNSDILETKILAYTNKRVDAFNIKIKEILFPNNEYNKFEFLTGTENLEYNNTKFWNSMDYIISDTPRKADVFIPGFICLPGYYLNLYNSSSKILEEVFILTKEIEKDYFDSLAYHIENVRIEAVVAKQKRNPHASKLWKEYYKLINSFTSPVDLYYSNRLIRKKSFDYGYASTTHRSQGSSINNVFIDMNNIKSCKDLEELRQLQYVAVSRAINDVHILQ
jgi:ATP-dependent exoDNAse (exonuclease V) alpha subunit